MTMAPDNFIIEANELTDEAVDLLALSSMVDMETEMRFARERRECPTLDHLENPTYPDIDSLIR